MVCLHCPLVVVDRSFLRSKAHRSLPQAVALTASVGLLLVWSMGVGWGQDAGPSDVLHAASWVNGVSDVTPAATIKDYGYRQTGLQNYASDGHEVIGSQDYGFTPGQGTWFIAAVVPNWQTPCEKSGTGRNACNWWGYAGEKGMLRGAEPRINAIMCMGSGVGGGVGQVALVLGISGNTITVADSNWIAVGHVGIHTVSPANASWSHIQGYIYRDAIPYAPTELNPSGDCLVRAGTNCRFTWRDNAMSNGQPSYDFNLQVHDGDSAAAPLLTDAWSTGRDAYWVPPAGKRYCWQVIAGNGTGLSAPSAWAYFRASHGTRLPTLLSPAAAAVVLTGDVNFAWTDNGDEYGPSASFNFRYRKVGEPWQELGWAGGTSRRIAITDPGDYAWEVQSSNGQWASAFSEPVVFTVRRPGPRIVSATYSAGDYVDVLFDEELDPVTASDPDNYQIAPYVHVRDIGVAGGTVHLVTSPQSEDTRFTVTARNVADRDGYLIREGEGDTASWITPGDAPCLAVVQYMGPHCVDLLFSETVQKADANFLGNYHIEPPLPIVSATLYSDDGMLVRVITALQTPKQRYTISVSGIRDMGGHAIVAGSSGAWERPATPTLEEFIARLRWYRATGVVPLDCDLDGNGALDRRDFTGVLDGYLTTH
jgi:surface antigen